MADEMSSLDAHQRLQIKAQNAIQEGDLQGLRAALSQDVDLAKSTVHWDRPNGSTLLHLVCGRKGAGADDVDMAKALLDAGAGVDEIGMDWSSTPMMLAAWRGKTTLIELLLNRGATPNARTSLGETPLQRAAGHKHPDAVFTLICAGSTYGLHELIWAGMNDRAWQYLVSTPTAVNQLRAFSGESEAPECG